MAKWCGILDTAVLRSHADFVEARFDSELQPDGECIARDMRLLADELDAARQRIAALQAALRPFAERAANVRPTDDPDWRMDVLVSEIRAAAAAMGGEMKNDVTYGDLLKRIEALEADAIWHPRCPPGHATAAHEPLEYTRHPAYITVAEWRQKAEANQAAADLFAKLRDGRAILNDGKDAWLTCIAPTQISKWQAAADTLERLKQGESAEVEQHKFSLYPTGQPQKLRAERDTLAEKVADLQSRLKQCEAVVDAWAPYKSGEWVAADTLAELRRDAKRWRDVSSAWRSGSVLTAMEMLANEKEATT